MKAASPNSARRWFGLIMAVLVLVPSMIGFSNKLLEFFALYRGDADGVFALSPIMNYLLAAGGFFFLFCWAITQGMFKDIEQPKFALLEVEDQLDAQIAKGAIHA